MKKTLMICMAAMTMAVAQAATYKVQLFQPSTVAGSELKPGEYSIEVNDSTAVIKKGKESVQAPVRVESVDNKYSSTSVRYANSDGKYKVQEIRLGGTKTKLVFTGEAQPAGGAQ